jgi:hypothetical protein
MQIEPDDVDSHKALSGRCRWCFLIVAVPAEAVGGAAEKLKWGKVKAAMGRIAHR